MAERETITVTTPVGGKQIILKAWLTGREKLQLSKADQNDVTASSKLAIETVVQGVTFEEVADMHGRDFDFVLDEITKVVEGSTSPKAQPSSTGTPPSSAAA